MKTPVRFAGADLGGGCRGWAAGEVEQETSAPPPKKNPGSADVLHLTEIKMFLFVRVP